MGHLWLPLSLPDQERLKINKAEKIYLYDENNRCYIDGNSGLWNVPLGYSNERIKSAVYRQMTEVSYVNPECFSNEVAEQLADSLIMLLPSTFDRVYLTCTGSESIELAIKLVRKYQSLLYNHKRKHIAVMDMSYHGSYYGSMSASSFESKSRNGYGPLLPGFIELDAPYDRRIKFSKMQQNSSLIHDINERILQKLEQIKDELAAILIEPVLGSGGVLPVPMEIMHSIMKFAKENHILIIFDEVATGFGRTGKMFRFEKIGYQPDILVLSKGINNGMLPLGAVVASKQIIDVFRMKKEFLFHLSTQDTNPLCCIAGCETINQLKENDYKIITEVDEKGEYFRKKVCSIMDKYEQVYDVRGEGLMNAIELADKDGYSTLRPDKLEEFMLKMKENGVLCTASYTANIISAIIFFLPFIISYDEMDSIVNKIEVTIQQTLV